MMKIVRFGLIGGWTYHEKSRQCEEVTVSRGGEFSKCTQPNNTLEMEVEVSMVNDGSYSSVVFSRGSTQGQREEKV